MTTKTLFGILNADGTMQVDSNDRGLRIVLSRFKNIQDGEIVETFQTSYYIKEGFGYEKTLESHNYNTADEFLQAISTAADFTEAVNDIKQQKETSHT